MVEEREGPEPVVPARLPEGKDELNLAEFPLCALADRLPPDQKSLKFEDRIWDDSRGETIVRQLTIAGSEEFGLPTALDDEVLLGLIQLSKLQQFADRKVHFSRYQLIRILGWRDESRSYERLETSLNRWVGVTLYYQNAWWDKGQQCWADEKFHVLDNVTFFDQEKARRRSRTQRQAQLPISNFVWNEVIFRSFQAGNLKSIDLDFYKGLESSVAKRLYRFLDKRFFHRPRFEFDLKELSWEHVGLSRSYDAAGLKRKLKTGITELEQSGFLQPMSDEERFRKVCSGDWRVVLHKARPVPAKPLADRFSVEQATAFKVALVQRGITPSAAHDVTVQYPLDRIRSQLEVFDWLMAQGDARVSRNPAGFLIASIKSEYAPPKGFVSRDQQQRRTEAAAERRRKLEQRKIAQEEREHARLQAQQDAIKQFWDASSPEERARLEAEALAQAEPFQRDLLQGEGTLARTTRQHILDAYALKMMQLGA